MQHLSEGTLLQGGKFKIEKMLGQGGFGITYLASQTISVEGSIGEIKTEIKLAIKEFFMKDVCNRNEDSNIVSVPSVGSKELVERFKQKFIKEAHSISKLKHPHIVKVVDVFEENGTAYYVMEYHNGGSLGDLVKDGNPLSESDAVRYITQIADAVGYIHKQKVNHLDIKPGNILLDGKANGILIGFGLSKQYDEKGSTPVGISHGYAPMEQYNPGGVSTFTPQSDIYSLGATLYKLVTGTTPPQANEIFNDGLPTLPAHLSDGVKRAIEQSLKPRKIDRPATAEEFIALLSADAAVVVPAVEPAADESTKIIASEETLVVKPVEEPAPEPVNPATPEIKQPETPKPIEKKKKKNSLWLWVVAVAVVVVAFILWNCIQPYCFYHHNNSRYREGLSIGRYDGILGYKYGFVDEKGKIVIPIKYDAVRTFYEGLAAVELNDKWGFIDKSGNEVIPLKYDDVWDFSEGQSTVSLNGKYGIINKTGKVVIPIKYDLALSSSEGLTQVKLNDNWGFVDINGNEVIPLKYDYVHEAEDGLFRFLLNGKHGYVDINGNEVIPCDKYDFVGHLYEGLLRVKLNDKWGFVDKKGYEAIPLKYDAVGEFSEGLAEVKLNGKWGFIDKDDNVIIPLKYDEVGAFSEDFAAVKLYGKWGYIDKSGKMVIPFKYYDETYGFSEGLACVKSIYKYYGFIDKSGNEVISLKYSWARHFSEGLACVRLNDKYGFVDKSGNEVIPLKYDSCENFRGGRAAVELNGERFYIDKQGNRVD